ncbi:F0F1 ATP synthase subunit epsilon [Flaviflagellibacter deserti]|jgi:F-type H+-transporting ATPase subunit epsilon|uniref:ATP synthase epsilon chain n=1 Tax=Flaviflagellibacter deserti TaxID=2267266 RepID=A0ABV9Z5A5_9HYPH
MASFPFELVSPERLVVSEEADEVTVPGIEGEFTVLAGHAPFITVLRPGIVTARSGSNARRYYVRGGFAEVNPTGLTILADLALPVEELNDARFATEIAAAEHAISLAHDDESRAKAQQQLAWIKDLQALVVPHHVHASH